MRLVFALLAALFALAPVAEAQTLKIGTTPSFIFLPIYAADQLGYFKGEPSASSLWTSRAGLK